MRFKKLNISAFQICNFEQILVWRFLKTVVILPCQKDKEMFTAMKASENSMVKFKILLRIFCGYNNYNYFCCPKINGQVLKNIFTIN